MDSLEIGKKKYIDLRRLLLSDVQLPGYNRLATHRSQICLTNEIFSVERKHQVGIAISYSKLLTHRVNRILTTFGNEFVGDSKYEFQMDLTVLAVSEFISKPLTPIFQRKVLFYLGLR